MKKPLLVIVIIAGAALVAGLAPLSIKLYPYLSFSKEKESRIIREAIASNNSSLCEELPDAIPDIEPQDDCYRDVSLATNNSAICKLTHRSDFCYFDIAIKYKNVSICDNIPVSSTMKEECIRKAQ